MNYSYTHFFIRDEHETYSTGTTIVLTITTSFYYGILFTSVLKILQLSTQATWPVTCVERMTVYS